MNRTPVTLARDCTATTVPYGEQVALSAGGQVEIVQRLGRSITVRTPMGTLLRIDGDDADALGLGLEPERERGAAHPTAGTERPPGGGRFDMALVWEALGGIYDPEIPVSIVELGLVYRCEEAQAADGHRRIEIDMTMTAPGCGMGDVLRADAVRAVQVVPGVDEVEVNLVWSPRWTVAHMSEAARLQLGLL